MKIFLLLTTLAINLSGFAQDDKTITLVASGQGKTLDVAKENALRSAIEQAFGTFISSNTEILNDNLIKDEIVSVSNGNIQKFENISEIQIPNGDFITTVKATVSVNKLTTFIESKGGNIEFKGSLFSFNIKQQILNEQNELKVVDDLLSVLKKLIDNSFDYVLNSGTPEAIDGGNINWNIPFTLMVKSNDNYSLMYSHLINTLQGISLNESELQNYTSLNKEVFLIDFIEKKIYLRNQQSYEKLITELTLYFCKSILSAKISNNTNQHIFSPNLNKSKFQSTFLPISFTSSEASVQSSAKNLFEIAQYLSYYNPKYQFQSVVVSNKPGNGTGYSFGNIMSLKKYSNNAVIVKITINQEFTLDEINKISEFKVLSH
jgi:hypothetical protein